MFSVYALSSSRYTFAFHVSFHEMCYLIYVQNRMSLKEGTDNSVTFLDSHFITFSMKRKQCVGVVFSTLSIYMYCVPLLLSYC